MITLSLIKNAGGAAKYYAADNYYLAEADAKDASEWLGRGAAELGLKGKVEEQQLQKILEGKLPNGVTVGFQKDGKQNHRPGYDICFHAPKSVSILALEGKDQRFYDAHLSAVKETLALIERDCAQAKVYKDEKISFQSTKNLSIALVKHITSRDLDPQLHHHALIMNTTKKDDGNWRALASSKVNDGETNGFFERVHKNQIYYGVIYQAALASKVVELGCEIETVGPHGLWEIKGVPKEAREALSKRRQVIEEHLDKLHYKSLKAADVAALDTREKKSKELNIDGLREAWKSELEAIGFSSREFIAKLPGKALSRNLHETAVNLANDKLNATNKESDSVNVNAKEAIENAIAHLSGYHLKLDYATVLSQALELSIGRVTHKDVISAFNEQIKSGALIPIDKDGALFVTKELLDIEKNITNQVAQGKDNSAFINIKASALNKLEDNEIKESLVKTLQTNSRVVLVESQLTNNAEFISGILNLSEASGKNVRILSPNRAAALDINENIRRKPNTIWQWLLSLAKPELGESVAGFKYKYAREFDRSPTNINRGKDLILVHDAEMVGAKDVEKILELTEASKAKVVFLQNHGFRSNLSAGNSMVSLKRAGVDTVHLGAKEAPKITDPQLVVIKENEERIKSLAKVYAGKEDKDRAQTTILVGSKDQVKLTNQAIREELKSQNKLSASEVAIKTLVPIYMSNVESRVANKYQNNMIIRFYKEGAPAEDWKIESINKDRNLIRLFQNGKRVLWNPKDDVSGRSLYKKGELQIAKGDRLVALANMNLLDIKNGTKFIVSDIGDAHIKLTSNKKSFKVDLKDLHNGHLDYDYATTISRHAKKETSHILADVKAYFLDKATYNELTRRAKDTLTIFTNDRELAEKRLGSSCPRLTATETILDTTKGSKNNIEVDRLINDRTTHELKQDIEKAILGLKEQYLKNESKSIEDKAVEFAINKITSHNAGFTHKELITEALTYALQNELKLGTQITHEVIMGAIEQKRASGELVMGKHFSDGTRWTTKEHLDLERSIIEKIKDGKNKISPLLDSKTTASLLDKVSSKNNLNLTQDQKNACNLITTTKDRFVMIQGYAGTGKTTLFRSVRDVLNERVEVNKHEIANSNSKDEIATNPHAEAATIFALAPTHRAVKELKTLGVEAQTLKSFLIEHNKEIKKDSPISKFDNTLFILDEASMVSNSDFTGFLNIIDGTNCRVVLNGDIAQHISVESGKPFEIIQKSNIVDTAYLKEIIRQKNPIIKGAVENVISGDYKEAFNKIGNASPGADIERTRKPSFLAALQNSIVERDNNELKSKDKTLEALVADDFLTRTKQVRDNTVVIVHVNKDRKTINELIREGLKKEGVVAKNGFSLDCFNIQKPDWCRA